MVDVLWAGSGSDVARAVERALDRFQSDDPLVEVVIVTPPGATAGTLRRLLPHARDGRGVAGVRFTTAVDYALELAPADVRSRRPITPQLLAAAVRRELSLSSCPPELVAVKDHRSTLDALVTAAERLRNVHAAPAPEVALSRLSDGSSSRRALVTVAANARAALTDAGFRDEPTVLVAATEALRDDDVAKPLPPAVIVLTDCYHPGQLAFLERLVRANREVVMVALTPQPGDTALAHQIQALADTGVNVQAMTASGIRPPHVVVSCPDQDEEVRQAVRTVVGLATGVGVPTAIGLDRIVVLYPPAGGYSRRIADELSRSGIAWSGPAAGTLAESIAGCCVRFLLVCLERCDRQNVFRLLDVAPLWTSRNAGQRATTRWRTLCRDLKLVTEADWRRAEDALVAHQAERRERFGKPGDEPDERDLRTVKQFRQLLEIVSDILRARSELAGATSWTEASRLFGALLARHAGSDAWRGTAWADIPIWQHRAASQVEERLRALANLDDPTFPIRYSLSDFGQIAATLIDAPLGRQGDPAIGVRVLGLNHGVCLDADVVFVVGVNDGLLPAAPTEDLLIRRSMPPECGRWLEGAEWAADRLIRAWGSLLNSSAEVHASFARSDLRRGGELYPSSWLHDVVEAGRVDLHESHRAGLDDERSLTVNEVVRREGPGAARRYEVLRRRALAAKSRLQPIPTEFDGQLGVQPILDPKSKVHAITAFESLANCGTGYLLRYVLKVDDTTDPAEITMIEARDKGDLVHNTLERLVDEWLELPDDQRPEWLQGDHLDLCIARAARVIDDHADALRAENRLGHEMAWSFERAMLLQAISQTLRTEAAERAVPVRAEHSFGMDEGAEELIIETAHGPIRFRGRIDRIDRLAGGLRVTDFKTSGAATKQTMSKKTPTDGGKKLQLPIYARVARRDFGDNEEPTSARYLYLRRSRSEAVDLPPLAFEHYLADLDELAGRMATGDLRPGVPHDLWNCSSCSPDNLGLEIISLRAQGWIPTDSDGEAAE